MNPEQALQNLYIAARLANLPAGKRVGIATW